jgi:Domain of unknown function (DUF4499)
VVQRAKNRKENGMNGATDRRETFVAVAPGWYASNLGGVIATGLLAKKTGARVIRWTFYGAVALHVGEAAYANHAARKAGFTNSAWKWGLQTLAVGFPSLLALRDARAAEPAVSAELGPEG